MKTFRQTCFLALVLFLAGFAPGCATTKQTAAAQNTADASPAPQDSSKHPWWHYPLMPPVMVFAGLVWLFDDDFDDDQDIDYLQYMD